MNELRCTLRLKQDITALHTMANMLIIVAFVLCATVSARIVPSGNEVETMPKDVPHVIQETGMPLDYESELDDSRNPIQEKPLEETSKQIEDAKPNILGYLGTLGQGLVQETGKVLGTGLGAIGNMASGAFNGAGTLVNHLGNGAGSLVNHLSGGGSRGNGYPKVPAAYGINTIGRVAYVVNGADNCWSSCKTGPCAQVCGLGGYCCRKGWNGCPSDMTAVAPNHHTCIKYRQSVAGVGGVIGYADAEKPMEEVETE